MINRRRFMRVAGMGVAATAYRGIALGAPLAPDRSFEHGRPLHQFQYHQIQFEPGLQQSQLEQTHSVLMDLNDDSLLKPYRLRASLPAPGCDLGGWYSSNDFAGQTFGQWMSALSRYYGITQDEATRAKVDRLVRGFSQTIDPTGKLFPDKQ